MLDYPEKNFISLKKKKESIGSDGFPGPSQLYILGLGVPKRKSQEEPAEDMRGPGVTAPSTVTSGPR